MLKEGFKFKNSCCISWIERIPKKEKHAKNLKTELPGSHVLKTFRRHFYSWHHVLTPESTVWTGISFIK